MEYLKTELYFIVNPKAGSGKTMHCWELAEQVLAASGIPYRRVDTEHKFHAVSLAAEAAAQGFRNIFAAGGDGTLHEVLSGICAWCTANGVPAEEFHVGVVPVGSGNDWIKSMNIPADPEAVVKMALEGHYTPIDTVRVTGHDGTVTYMANVGGTGFDSHVCEVVNRQKEQGKRGRLIYCAALLRTVCHLKSIRIRVEADGKEVFSGPAYSIAMGNGRYSGSGMLQVPLAAIDDGLLDYMIVPEVRVGTIIREVPRLFDGTLNESDAVLSGRCRVLRIEPLDEESADIFETDGEVIAKLPVTVEVTGSRINALGSVR